MFHQAKWQKARNCTGGNCVEVAPFAGQVAVRDGKTGTAGPVLVFSAAEWATFLEAVKAGQFDDTVA
ncbi:DUF397 domain-containing protein [Streptosporangiaceae bacterium NEAU-GS5]|nr:DUF397 domain-containing protein [Streptosporangiaceae bacterium NEAU-GS5]